MRRMLLATLLLMVVCAWPAAADDVCADDPGASFCAGPSDQEPAAVGVGYLFAGCQPDDSDVLVVGQVTVLSGTVTFALERDGVQVASETLARQERGNGRWLTDVLEAGGSAVYRLYADGTLLDETTVTAVGCVPLPDAPAPEAPAVPAVTEPAAAAAVETLPHTGVSVPLLVVAGAVLLMVGAWLAGRPRA